MNRKNDPVVLAIFIAFMLLIIFLVIMSRRKAKKAEEQKRLQAEERARIAKERARVEAEKERQKQEEENRRELAVAELTGLIGSDRWDEDELCSDPDQLRRIDRLKYDASKMSVLAYDSRFNLGLIRGTTGNQYITSGARCNCPDFLQQKKPCKHMYYLGHFVTEKGYSFFETDYEYGLKGANVLLVGRFPGGKEKAKEALSKRGCTFSDSLNSDVNLAVAGNTTARKMLDNILAREIPLLTYENALQLFTSEIREKVSEDQCVTSP